MLIHTWRGPLESGTLLGRRHRFLVDVRLDDGQQIEAYCASPGRMEGLVRPGSRIWLSRHVGGKRNLEWTWELIKLEDSLVCANSKAANEIVFELLSSRMLSGFKRFDHLRREVPLGNSARIDFLIQRRRESHYIEVKNVQQVSASGIGYFPDSIVSRSTKHLKTLTAAVKKGHRATLLAVIQRTDAKCFRPSDAHDPVFCSEIRRASKLGVEILAISVQPSIHGFRFLGPVPTILAPLKSTELENWRAKMAPFSGWARPVGNPDAPWRG